MNQREASKQNWVSKDTIQEINSGSLQRIADATERMAVNYVSLQEDLDRYKRWYEERGVRINNLYKQVTWLKGLVTRYKNKANKKNG